MRSFRKGQAVCFPTARLGHGVLFLDRQHLAVKKNSLNLLDTEP